MLVIKNIAGLIKNIDGLKRFLENAIKILDSINEDSDELKKLLELVKQEEKIKDEMLELLEELDKQQKILLYPKEESKIEWIDIIKESKETNFKNWIKFLEEKIEEFSGLKLEFVKQLEENKSIGIKETVGVKENDRIGWSTVNDKWDSSLSEKLKEDTSLEIKQTEENPIQREITDELFDRYTQGIFFMDKVRFWQAVNKLRLEKNKPMGINQVNIYDETWLDSFTGIVNNENKIDWEKYRRDEDYTIDLKKVFLREIMKVSLYEFLKGINYIEEIESINRIKSRQVASVILINAKRISEGKE